MMQTKTPPDDPHHQLLRLARRKKMKSARSDSPTYGAAKQLHSIIMEYYRLLQDEYGYCKADSVKGVIEIIFSGLMGEKVHSTPS
jgi:hypothetical protein